MKVLIACEESQRTCLEFRKRGHLAFSCDLKECSGGYPEWHFKSDALKVLYSDSWDLVIAHPPCTFLSKAGATSAFPGGVRDENRWRKTLAAREFFMSFFEYHACPVAIENPIPFRGLLPEPSQIIQPFFFGDPFYKTTCLWLYELPELVADNLVLPAGGSWTFKHSSPSIRSKTFPGIARAFAEQWGEGYGQLFLI